MQAMGATADLVTRHEFHYCPPIPPIVMPLDGQAQPFRGRLLVETEVGGAGIRVPGAQQIGLVAQHIGAVTRTHQRFGIGRQAGAGEIGRAACSQGVAGAAGTIGVTDHGVGMLDEIRISGMIFVNKAEIKLKTWLARPLIGTPEQRRDNCGTTYGRERGRAA